MRNLSQVVGLLFALLSTHVSAAELKVLLPQGRVAYQTNEHITLSALRRDADSLPATDLTMTVSGADGSQLTFVFPLAAVDLATLPKEQMLIDGIAKWTALRPGAIALVNHFN